MSVVVLSRRVSGMGFPSDQLEGAARGGNDPGEHGISVLVPGERTWLRVKVARWSSRPRKLR